MKISKVLLAFNWVAKIASKINWLNLFLISVGLVSSLYVFYFIFHQPIAKENAKSILSNILTVNGVFSAILITFLLNRIAWIKSLKQEDYKKLSS